MKIESPILTHILTHIFELGVDAKKRGLNIHVSSNPRLHVYISNPVTRDQAIDKYQEGWRSVKVQEGIEEVLRPQELEMIFQAGVQANKDGKSILVSDNRRVIEWIDGETVDNQIDIIDQYQKGWLSVNVSHQLKVLEVEHCIHISTVVYVRNEGDEVLFTFAIKQHGILVWTSGELVSRSKAIRDGIAYAFENLVTTPKKS